MAAGGQPPAGQAVARTPGFRFYPTEEELICFYLRNKLDGRRDDIERVIPVFDVYSVDPRELSETHERLLGVGAGEGEEPWFYFCRRQEREARGGRPSRTTPSGYWKAAGTPSVVYSAGGRWPVGVKKTMVFYHGRAPSGTKTSWKMHEYRAFQCDAAGATILPPELRSEFSLCRLYTRSGSLRQFDRRPLAAAAGGGAAGEALAGPSTAAAASPDDDSGSGGSVQMPLQQQPQMDGGDGDPYADDEMATTLAALLY